MIEPMDRQLKLDYDCRERRMAALRDYLRQVALASREVDVLCLMAGDGELIQVGDQQGARLAIAKTKAGRILGCSGNTFLAGVEDLRTRGLLEIDADTSPRTYYVNWDRVRRLEPVKTGGGRKLALFDPDQTETWSGAVNAGQARSTPVNAGQPVRVRESMNLKSVSYRDSVSTVSSTGELTGVDRNCPPLTGADRLDRPWHREHGVTDEILVGAVGDPDRGLKVLWRLFQEAVSMNWITDSEDNRQRFLSICHHAATSPGLTISRMGNVVSRVKRGLSVDGIRAASDQWAGEIRARRRRDPALSR